MTPEQEKHVEMWLAALRSGEFRQGEGALCYNNRYCCLGVAAELACGPDGSAELAALRYESEEPTKPIGYDDYTEGLSEPFQDWFGLQSSSGAFRLTDESRALIRAALAAPAAHTEVAALNELCKNNSRTSLAELNDYGLPFPVIADVIAARPPELFMDEDEENE